MRQGIEFMKLNEEVIVINPVIVQMSRKRDERE